ncbi:MAG: hypothetical protein WAK82_31555 [Streptosporangiaceae bacterium]
MGTSPRFFDCPAYLDKTGAARCGLPAEVEDEYTLQSTDGPLGGVRIRCPRGHWFNGPAEALKLPVSQDTCTCDGDTPAARLRGLLPGPPRAA